MVTMRSTTVVTPDGPFSILAGHEAVLASGWTRDLELLASKIHPRLRAQLDTTSSHTVLAQAEEAVHCFYRGELGPAADIPVNQVSGAFHEASWAALRRIEPGHPVTYAEFAALAGRPKAVRAAAGACAHNAAALFIPCHRVVRSDGSIGGFAYGTEIKQSLLTWEKQPHA